MAECNGRISYIEELVELIDKNEIHTIKVHGKEFAEVVRCKDCKFYLNSSEKCALIDTRLQFYARDKIWTEEDYCSWGERKGDE